MSEHEYKHWCGNCQIKIYVQRHYGRALTWHDCPYTCEYATEMRCSIEPYRKDVPERNVGKWEVYYDDDDPQDGIWKCSSCGYIRFVDDSSPTNYCPHCGADMRKETEDVH